MIDGMVQVEARSSFRKSWSHPLVNPRDAGEYTLYRHLNASADLISIVEFSNADDAKKAKEELADKTLLGRPVFIREVRLVYLGDE